MIRFILDKMLEYHSDAVRLQPEYVEITDTGAALALNRVLHGLKRIPRGVRIVNKVVSPVSAGGGTGGAIPVGTIAYFGVSSAPTGWLLCDGSAVSRTTYADLFTAIGTTFGVGDGSTTFNVPDLRGRAPIGSGTGSGLTARTLGASGGAETHQLTEAELASHTHVLHMGPLSNEYTLSEGSGDPLIISPIGTGWVIDDAGSDQAHNNMQPFLVVTPCICYEPSAGSGGSSAYVPLDWHRLATDPDWTVRELTLRFNLANARVLLEVF